MEEQSKSNRWIIFVGIGCIAILCICGTLVGVFLVFQRTAASIPFTSNLQNLVPNEILQAIETPDPLSLELPTLPVVDLPTLPAIGEILPTLESLGAVPGLTGSQYADDFMLVDDFSSDALGWPVYDDGLTILKFENQAYSFQITEPDYLDWAYVPVTFDPSFIMFDVWGLPGDQNGTFGVFCQFQDPTNYYYVEFDLQTRETVIGMIENDEFVPLTEANSSGQYWIPVDALGPSPEDVNTIMIDCQLDSISLIVNEELVHIVPIDSPFEDPGVMAFFLFTFSFAGPDGFHVFIDNVTIR